MRWIKHSLLLLVMAVTLLSGCGSGVINKIYDKAREEKYVTVNGVKLHYLDWGGSGEPILFLAGLGCNAHIYDDLAVRFKNNYHPLALTRRGFGQSDQPQGVEIISEDPLQVQSHGNYTVQKLVEDIIGLLDQLGIQKVHLVGHSMAGNELTYLAAHYPNRVGKIIYLDAGFNYALFADNDEELPDSIAEPSPTEEDYQTVAKYKAFYKRLNFGNSMEWSFPLEENFNHDIIVGPNGSVTPRTDITVLFDISQCKDAYYAELADVKAPVLAIYAIPGSIFQALPWLPTDINGTAKADAENYLNQIQVQLRNWTTTFKSLVPHAEVQVWENNTHYFFLQNSAYATNVASEITIFLNKN